MVLLTSPKKDAENSTSHNSFSNGQSSKNIQKSRLFTTLSYTLYTVLVGIYPNLSFWICGLWPWVNQTNQCGIHPMITCPIHQSFRLHSTLSQAGGYSISQTSIGMGSYWVSPTLVRFYPENVRKSLANSWVLEIGLGHGNDLRANERSALKPLMRSANFRCGTLTIYISSDSSKDGC